LDSQVTSYTTGSYKGIESVVSVTLQSLVKLAKRGGGSLLYVGDIGKIRQADLLGHCFNTFDITWLLEP
jgi:hypothetical protein